MFNLLTKAAPKKRLLFYKLGEFLNNGDSPPIALISGARMTGKTTLLAQITEKYYKAKSVLYLNFRDETAYSSRQDWASSETAEQILIDFLLSPSHTLLLLDEITSLDDYEHLCERVHDMSGGNITGVGYKALITGSSPFQIKALHSGSLGGGRSTLLQLPVLKFIEYMHLTTDRITYADYINVTAQDFAGYLSLDNLPYSMLRTFDEQYFINYYEENSLSGKNTRIRGGVSDITSDDMIALAHVLAYQLAGRINYNKLFESNTGKKELAPFGGWRKFPLEKALVEASRNRVANFPRELRSSAVARILRFLLKSHIINAETELTTERDEPMDVFDIAKLLGSGAAYGDMMRLFDKVSFAMNSPLLYTRLSDDILRQAGFSWKEFTQLPANQKNVLYGDLLEVYVRGGISELRFLGLPFTSAKLNMEPVAAIDVVDFRKGLLCEITISNKDTQKVHVGTRYANNSLIRVCSTKDIGDTKGCYYQIPYPLLCCMVDTGDILKLKKTTVEDADISFDDIRGIVNKTAGGLLCGMK